MGTETPDIEGSFRDVAVWIKSMACRETVQMVLSDRGAALAKLQS
jgi:hypothetical protein